jgi:UDP-N-acetylmuramoyl-L-alanyl-D-glutamate--2,6-diaminopimelate ligase
VANALGAATAAILAGVPAEIVAAALGRAPAVPGRMEAVPGSGEVTVLVDYAHTADAVEAALATLRPITRGSLWIVLGAGGDRDHGKRPKMAAAAARLADRVILTSDNPRSEDPAAGKGHEETQEIRGEKFPFSDRREVEKALAERGRA